MEEDDEEHTFDRYLVPGLFLFLSLDEVRDPTLYMPGCSPHQRPTAMERAELTVDVNAKSFFPVTHGDRMSDLPSVHMCTYQPPVSLSFGMK